ncbi:MAG: hypothetical protein UT48_C0004G0016 [Parcubacteria group bacterium GW2011_GWE2_39_37]|uniref:Uncharacterized protein n=1 Tax=Candidatus Falkowbacteria bacterium GW2011_GWF2_39_8 TaxID=1618642 RepID=A0A0G0S8W4_9BACT|nr:MAG: hypothetical protein UT48_C0004G0016 [Parcubacteria group bacterium GW2011_GWE2_39_37]KKR31185.1 MAG: hypothetical protein UT64_C0070G0013 [Candidatus Falkowbacteria bacterium GW2011_GWF2_39_8]
MTPKWCCWWILIGNNMITISKRLIFYVYLSVFTIIGVVLFFTSLFLYKNVFNTSAVYDEIISLQRITVAETVNMRKFNEVVEKIDKKVSAKETAQINDIFK